MPKTGIFLVYGGLGSFDQTNMKFCYAYQESLKTTGQMVILN